jgi:transcriptional regulator with XRE-family HTH domain
MTRSTLGTRLDAAMKAQKLTPPALATLAETTPATVHNWLHDNVQVDHIKASQLFRMADAVHADPRGLLFGEDAAIPAWRVNEEQSNYPSHPVQSEHLILALQLVTEELAKRDRVLPPEKQAEAIKLTYDLLEEGLPRAKVLRFVHAAVA